ncbi:MAG: DUF3891 family protein [Chloroflexota bacterium]
MFSSKVRPINLTQFEHGRLCGTLASHWGNERFDKPTIDFETFVTAVTLHDWHYKLIDDTPITLASDEEWLEITNQGVELWFDDPTVDILIKLHIKRLLSFGIHVTDDVPRMIDAVDVRIASRLKETSYTMADFLWADRITRICDFLSFDLHFEKPVSRECQVFANVGSDQETAITHQILGPGEVRVDPWPFDRPEISGFLVAYAREGYPDRLKPQRIPYQISPRSTDSINATAEPTPSS